MNALSSLIYNAMTNERSKRSTRLVDGVSFRHINEYGPSE